MKPRCNHVVKILVVGTALLGILPVLPAWPAEPPSGTSTGASFSGEIARVGAVQGDVKVQRAGEAKYKKIDKNAPLYLMDYLSTGRASKIWWKGSPGPAWTPYPDTTHGSLGENTVFGFESFHRRGPTVKFVGNIRKGIVRFIKKLPRTDPPSVFAIATPTAWIQVEPGDRAADFTVEYVDPPRTTITVFWGRVRVKNISKELVQERILTSCQEVDVEKDKEPGEIRYVSTDTMKNLIKRTTIPNTLPTDVPSCERIKSEVIERPGAVHVPPRGAVVVPIPVPIPLPPPGEKCPCPPGSYRDPATQQCACCPPGTLYNADTCDCACPCPPGSQYDFNTRQCVPCRSTATALAHDPRECGCGCPCPPGQILLPGGGCVDQCPEGYIVSYDSSQSAPNRCPVCVQDGVPVSGGCTTDQQCGQCETCVRGLCLQKVCPDGEALNRANCSCRGIDGPFRPPCSSDSDCTGCTACRDGKCVQVITCGIRERLNLQTCTCEPLTTNGQISSTTGQPQCTKNSECPSGQICRNGRCVRRPPPQAEDESTFQATAVDEGSKTEEEPSGPRVRAPISIGIGIGVGGGSGGGGAPRGGTGRAIQRPQ